MTMSEERRRGVNISGPCCDVPSRWEARAGAFKDAQPRTLKVWRIIVLHNTPRAQPVARRYPGNPVLLVRLEDDGGEGIAFRKGDDALREQVNAAPKAIQADGSDRRRAAADFDFDISGGN